MYKIGICGHYSSEKNLLNGQTIKTKIVTKALIDKYGAENITQCDTHDWKRRPFAFFMDCVNLIKKSQNIIFLPAQSAIKVLLPLFCVLNKICNHKLHYYVVGGWLQESIRDNPYLFRYLKRLDGIYVELDGMLHELKQLGLDNVYFVHKFRELNIVDVNDISLDISEPHKLCIFSRIMKEKGIEEAIDSVNKINSEMNREVYTLDIYGQVEPSYKDRFSELEKNFPKSVRYCGCVDFTQSTEVLKNYYALLFPTYYDGEGYANTIVDAFAAALPVIATNWKYNGEVISDGVDGILYDYQKPELLTEILTSLVDRPQTIITMKYAARERAFCYSPDQALTSLYSKIE